MRRNDSLLTLLLEAQTLDRVTRSGYALRGVDDPESVSEHSWQVAFLVWALAPEVPGCNAERAVAMALLHDLAELRLGDLPRTAGRYFPPGAKKAAEAAALADILAPLGGRATELAADYEDGGSVEARLVRACDKLQLMLKVHVYEQWGAGGLAEFWRNPDNFPSLGLPAVDRLVRELREAHAQSP